MEIKIGELPSPKKIYVAIDRDGDIMDFGFNEKRMKKAATRNGYWLYEGNVIFEKLVPVA